MFSNIAEQNVSYEYCNNHIVVNLREDDCDL